MPLANNRDQVMSILIDYLVRKYGIKRERVHVDVDLESGLRLDGDDVSDFVQDVEKEFQLDLYDAYYMKFWPDGRNKRGIQGGFAPVKTGQITMDREAGGFQLIAQAARLPIGVFAVQQPQQNGLEREGFVARRFGLQFSPSNSHSEQLQGLKPRDVIAVRCMIRHG